MMTLDYDQNSAPRSQTENADPQSEGVQNGKSIRKEATEQTEIEKYWSIVEANPHVFSSWEYLLKLVEIPFSKDATSPPTDEDVANLKKAYNSMLEKYPLCFGYWKKYADHINSLEGHDSALAIYELGLKAISNSTYLWEHYLAFRMENCDDQELIESLFEKACENVGYDFINGHSIWDKYIEYELSKQNHPKVVSIYDRAITIPLHQYAVFFERYATYSMSRPIEELVSPEILAELESKIKAQESQESTEDVTSQSQKGATKSDTGDIKAEIRKAIYNMKSEIYLKTQEAVHKRWPFESEIKRTYFHVNALDSAQLTVWKKYLDFEENEGDVKSIKVLYDRCLVVCAFYEDIWIRYAKYLIRKLTDYDTALSVLKKACDIFIPASRPYIRLFYALILESQGKIDEARGVYEAIVKEVGVNAEVTIEYAYFEKRQNNINKAESIFNNALENADSKIKGYIEIQKVRLLHSVSKNSVEILKAYKEICERNPDCKYSHLVYFTYTLNNFYDDPHAVKECWESIKDKPFMDPQSKKDFAIRYREYAVERAESVRDVIDIELLIPGCSSLFDACSYNKKRAAEELNNQRSSKVQKTFSFGTPNQQQPQAQGSSLQYPQTGSQVYNAYPATYPPINTTANNYTDVYAQAQQTAAANVAPTTAPTASSLAHHNTAHPAQRTTTPAQQPSIWTGAYQQ